MDDCETQREKRALEQNASASVVDAHSDHVGEVSEERLAQGYLPGFRTVSRKLAAFGVESRGIERVLPEERSPQSTWGLCLIW
jgi:hypothetical protein